MGAFLYLFFILFFIVFLWAIPVFSVIRSNRAVGYKKLIWVMFTIILNWPIYLLFLMVTDAEKGD